MRNLNKAALAAAAGILLTAPWGLAPAQAKTSSKDAAASQGQRRRTLWERKLGLSEKDAKKLDDAFQSERLTMRPLHRELRDALQKLSDQVEDKAADADIQATLDRVQKARQALQTEMISFRSKLAGILTPTQRAKMMLWHMRHHMMGRGGMMGTGMGRFGPKGWGPGKPWGHGEGCPGCAMCPFCGMGPGGPQGMSQESDASEPRTPPEGSDAQ